MNERTTGATDQQIEAAIKLRCQWLTPDETNGLRDQRVRERFEGLAPYLVPPDTCIVSRDDLRWLCDRVANDGRWLSGTDDARIERIRAVLDEREEDETGKTRNE